MPFPKRWALKLTRIEEMFPHVKTIWLDQGRDVPDFIGDYALRSRSPGGLQKLFANAYFHTQHRNPRSDEPKFLEKN